METCLCLSSSSIFGGSLFDEFLDERPLDLGRTTFVASSGRENFSKFVNNQKFDTAVSHAEAPSHHSSTMVSQIASCLRPGGTLKVSEPTVSNTSHTITKCWLHSVMQSTFMAPAFGRVKEHQWHFGKLCSWQASAT